MISPVPPCPTKSSPDGDVRKSPDKVSGWNVDNREGDSRPRGACRSLVGRLSLTDGLSLPHRGESVVRQAARVGDRSLPAAEGFQGARRDSK